MEWEKMLNSTSKARVDGVALAVVSPDETVEGRYIARILFEDGSRDICYGWTVSEAQQGAERCIEHWLLAC